MASSHIEGPYQQGKWIPLDCQQQGCCDIMCGGDSGRPERMSAHPKAPCLLVPRGAITAEPLKESLKGLFESVEWYHLVAWWYCLRGAGGACCRRSASPGYITLTWRGERNLSSAGRGRGRRVRLAELLGYFGSAMGTQI